MRVRRWTFKKVEKKKVKEVKEKKQTEKRSKVTKAAIKKLGLSPKQLMELLHGTSNNES